ncbi:ATP-dependent Clp protease adaptor ClpS, partial [Rhizobium johnstonii]
MGLMSSALPLEDVDLRIDEARFRSWQTVVWNDPVNLMNYVAHVFREYFGFSAERAQ